MSNFVRSWFVADLKFDRPSWCSWFVAGLKFDKSKNLTAGAVYVCWRKRKFDLNKNLTKNGFRRHTSKSSIDNKYKMSYTITTVKVGGRQSRNERRHKWLKKLNPLLREQRRNAEKKSTWFLSSRGDIMVMVCAQDISVRFREIP